ncbi:unnamed protein product [Orchesella dallaii]|uniref:Uncharacterized protein n=1 Tax=Orchesella dallaii TaxID=48710 RepID=A0ABP1QXP2_9HEXA
MLHVLYYGVCSCHLYMNEQSLIISLTTTMRSIELIKWYQSIFIAQSESIQTSCYISISNFTLLSIVSISHHFSQPNLMNLRIENCTLTSICYVLMMNPQ